MSDKPTPAGFLYYAPGKTAINRATVDSMGLGPVFGNPSLPCVHTTTGPDGKGGMVFCPGPEGGHPSIKAGYFKDKQTWRSCDGGKFWLGYYTADRPTPRGLARAATVGRFAPPLGDGSRWMIPVAVSGWDPESIDLPMTLALGDSGRFDKRIPRPEFHALCQDAERATEVFKVAFNIGEPPEEEPEPMSPEDLADLAVRALQINYRVGKWEVNELGLLTTTNVGTIVGVLVDLPTALSMQEAIKKNDGASPASPDTADGSAA